jgi:hypothetical protein
VTAMDEHRRGGEPVTDEAAEAGAGVAIQHRPLLLLYESGDTTQTTNI